MICYNSKTYGSELTFEDYLKLPGLSYSGIKNEGRDNEFIPTQKMKLGTQVHSYLLTPEVYDHTNKEIVRPMAVELKRTIGQLTNHLKPEIAVTSFFSAQNFVMPYKGRIDLGIPGRLVVDLKVSEMEIDSAIKFFGYDKQLTGYCKALGCALAIIVSINPKTLKTKVTKITHDENWWNYQIITRGTPLI